MAYIVDIYWIIFQVQGRCEGRKALWYLLVMDIVSLNRKLGRLENAIHPVYLNYACLNACNKGLE